MKKRFIKAVIFIAILALVTLCFSSVFSYKFDDGILQIEGLYDQKDDTVDVLVVGSSRAYVNVSPACLWREDGIASYIVGGSIQPSWNSYYYLKEALKTQRPKLIMYEAYTTLVSDEYSDATRIIKNTFGMKLSGDKVEAISVSAPKDEYVNYYGEFMQYHSRYSLLTKKDFEKYSDEKVRAAFKGNYMTFASFPHTRSDVAFDDKTEKMPEKSEQYYRMLLSLAKDEGIPVLVFVAPYSAYSSYDRHVFNTAKNIAGEYGASFHDFNEDIDAMQINYATDCVDNAHLNYKGSVKFSSFLGKFIKEQFPSVPDRSGGEAYSSWDIDADIAYRRIANAKFQETNDMEKYFGLLDKADGYTVGVTVSGDISEAAASYVSALTGSSEIGAGSAFLIDGQNVTTVASNAICHIPVNSRDELSVRGGASPGIYIGHTDHLQTPKGINILIYDKKTDTLVDSVGFDSTAKYAAVRPDVKETWK